MKHFLFPLAALCATMAAHAANPTDTVVAKARTALGGESALNAVKCLRFELSATDANGKPAGAIISEYKAPMKLREIDYTAAGFESVNAIDGREGHRTLRRLDTGERRLEIMTAGEVDARRDFACANLYLLAVPAPGRGEVTLGAPTKIDGVECSELAYKYKSGVTLHRFIDNASGRLVATRIDFGTKRGDLMINKGEQKVAGISYPKEIILRDDAGKTVRTLTINKIEVNGDLDDSAFQTPLF